MNHSSDIKCLVILGMHRSGTSALAGALFQAGFNPGIKLFDPEDDNPRGNFENARITLLNENILDELYAKWYDTLLIPDKWWMYSHFNQYHDQIVKILKEEFNADKPVLIKDPRLSVLLPLYLKAFEALKVDPRFIISFRNPLEITASLIKRNNLSRENSLLLWMDHYLKAEQYTRGFRRLFLSYQEFLNDPVSVLGSIKKNVADEIELTPENQNKIHSFLDKGLKHHTSGDQVPEEEASPELNELYEILKKSNLKDLTYNEIQLLESINTRFKNKYRFYNGLSGNFEAIMNCQTQNNKTVINRCPVKYGENTLVFKPDVCSSVIKLIFRPSNSRVSIKIHQVEVNDDAGETTFIEQMKSNAATETENRIMVFDSEMPVIEFELPSPLMISEVKIQASYVAFGRTIYNTGAYSINQDTTGPVIKSLVDQHPKMKSELQELKKELAKQNKEVSELAGVLKDKENELNIKSKKLSEFRNQIHLYEKEVAELRKLIRENSRDIENLERKRDMLESKIDAIMNSFTWKTGKLVTYPVKLIYNLFPPTKNK